MFKGCWRYFLYNLKYWSLLVIKLIKKLFLYFQHTNNKPERYQLSLNQVIKNALQCIHQISSISGHIVVGFYKLHKECFIWTSFQTNLYHCSNAIEEECLGGINSVSERHMSSALGDGGGIGTTSREMHDKKNFI